ncbi:MAG: hypothetical protein LDL41_10940 [Coleofasciculus sp. S288]|nr:hypothetical protein [Coleofasciculus sp. S288]
MVSIVSEGSAASFQASYQQLVENWVRTWMVLGEQQSEPQDEIEEENLEQTQQADEVVIGFQVEQTDEEVWITQKQPDGTETILYGKDEFGNQVNLLTPELITALEQVQVGDTLDGFGSITIRGNDEIFFYSDEEGKVLINKRLDAAINDATTQSYSGVNFEANSQAVASVSLESEATVEDEPQDRQVEVSQERDRDAYLQTLAELMVPLVMEAMKQEEQQSISQEDWEVELKAEVETESAVESSPMGLFEEFFAVSLTQDWEKEDTREEQSKDEFTSEFDAAMGTGSTATASIDVGIEGTTGLDAVKAATQQLRQDEPVKQVLLQTVESMQSTYKEQQQQPVDPAMQQIVSDRIKEKDNPGWWQQLSSRVEATVTAVRDAFTQHRAATTLKQFANRQGLRSDESYEAANYTLAKQGREYTLSDKQGNPLLRFESTVFGVKVDKTLPPLGEADFAKTQQLKADMEAGKSPGGAFRSQAVSEGQRLAQIQRIQTAMATFAARTPKADVQVEGSTYNWRANSKGSTIIQDKQGNVLLAAGNGYMRCEMSDKQLNDFEQMLAVASKSMQQSSQRTATPQLAAASRTKGKGLELD